MKDAFLNLNPNIQAAIISAIMGVLAGFLGAYIRYFFESKALRNKIQIEYEFAERKKLRELIGRYHGRLVESAERLNHRLWNLQKNQAEGWLNVNGIYDKPDSNYYFTTTVYRFVYLLTIGQLFTQEAIYIDGQISKKGELTFVKFIKAFEWVLTDVNLFESLDYDDFEQKDHLFRDKLLLLCSFFIEDEKVISLEKFQEKLRDTKYQVYINPMLMFF